MWVPWYHLRSVCGNTARRLLGHPILLISLYSPQGRILQVVNPSWMVTTRVGRRDVLFFHIPSNQARRPVILFQGAWESDIAIPLTNPGSRGSVKKIVRHGFMGDYRLARTRKIVALYWPDSGWARRYPIHTAQCISTSNSLLSVNA